MPVKDIRRGDLLVRNENVAYFVRDLEYFDYEPGSTSSMQAMCDVTVAVWRNPAVVGGKRGGPAPVTGLETVKCTPFDGTPGEMHGTATGMTGGLPAELLESCIDAGDGYYYVTCEKRESPKNL